MKSKWGTRGLRNTKWRQQNFKKCIGPTRTLIRPVNNYCAKSIWKFWSNKYIFKKLCQRCPRSAVSTFFCDPSGYRYHRLRTVGMANVWPSNLFLRPLGLFGYLDKQQCIWLSIKTNFVNNCTYFLSN